MQRTSQSLYRIYAHDTEHFCFLTVCMGLDRNFGKAAATEGHFSVVWLQIN